VYDREAKSDVLRSRQRVAPQVRASSIRVIRSDSVNGEVSNPRVTGIRPIFVAALAAAVLPACTQSCDALSSGEQFPIATDLFAHPMPIYWRDRLFSKMHYPSSHAGSPIATQQQTSGTKHRPTKAPPSTTWLSQAHSHPMNTEKTNGESTPPAMTSFSPARRGASSPRKCSPMGWPLTIVPSVLRRSRT